VTSRDNAERFRDYGISIKEFGAVGNGFTDDTTAINAAYAHFAGKSGTVIWPPGTYKVKACVRRNALRHGLADAIHLCCDSGVAQHKSGDFGFGCHAHGRW
jgi:hypothetical protein